MTARKRRKRSATSRSTVPVVLLVALILSLLVLFLLRTETGERISRTAARFLRVRAKSAPAIEFDDRLRQAALELGAKPGDIQIRSGGKLSPERWNILIPSNQSLLKCNVAVTGGVNAAGGRVVDAVEGISREGSQFLRMKLAFGGKATHTVLFQTSQQIPPVLRAVLAIVIDDLGYGSQELVEEFLALEYSLTFSVLPGYRKSRSTAEEVLAKGKELLLHLPMEPRGYPAIDPGKEAILVDLSDGEIKGRIGKHLGDLPKVAGISSHMGSLATQDPEVMKAVLEESKDRGLFFLDSMTTPGSVSRRVAAEVGAVCFHNDLFLDRIKNDERNVRNMFERAERIALSRGRAIAVGHLYTGTLKVLKEKLPELEAKGIRLVPVSYFAGTASDVL